MKKLSILIAALFVLHFIGCEEIPNGVIEEKKVNYIIEEIISPNQFNFSDNNASMEVSIRIKNSNSVEQAWFKIVSADGADDISPNNFMNETKNGEVSTFTGSTQFDENLLSGIYVLDFYIEDNVRNSDQNINKVGTKQFQFFGKIINSAPVISNLQLVDSVNREESFTFSITVNDENGLADIENVYFELQRPDGTTVLADQTNGNTKFPMFDNGDIVNAGDQSRDDGVFSLKNSFSQTSQTGNWTFIFEAVDKSGAVSNSITKKLKVN